VDGAISQPELDGDSVSNVGRLRLLLPHKARVGAVVIGLAGISVGAFAWFAIATHGTGADATSNALLGSCLLGSIAAAYGVWYGFSSLVSRRFAVDIGSVLQADAYSFLPLFALWLYLFQIPLTLSSAPSIATVALLLMLAVKAGLVARYSSVVRAVSVVFVATRVPLMLIAPLAAIVIGQRQGHHFSTEHGVLLDVWGRWDAEHYLTIATQGYHGKDVAFFPLYPFLVHVLGGFIGDHLIAGLLISNIAFAAALAYL
jgi:hypothetical protein